MKKNIFPIFWLIALSSLFSLSSPLIRPMPTFVFCSFLYLIIFIFYIFFRYFIFNCEGKPIDWKKLPNGTLFLEDFFKITVPTNTKGDTKGVRIVIIHTLNPKTLDKTDYFFIYVSSCPSALAEYPRNRFIIKLGKERCGLLAETPT